MRKNPKIPLVLLVILLALAGGCENRLASSPQAPLIDVAQDPVQAPCPEVSPIQRSTRDGRFTITPVASYRIAAMIAGKKPYSGGWNGELAPFDLALAWGRLAEPNCDRNITYRQSGRWYFYRYSGEGPVGGDYIATHSANHHIIPATENVRKAIEVTQEKQRLILEGFLVNVSGTSKNASVWWRTSRVRNDTGDGSCEVFYVERVTMGGYVYE